MTGFFIFEKRKMHWIRFYSLFLAGFLCVGAAGIPVFAADSYIYEVNSDTAATSESGTTGTTGTTKMSVMDTTSQASLIVSTGRGMVLYYNNEDAAANYPAASKLMTAVIALEALTLDTQVTISSDAQALDEKSNNPLFLSKGEKCSVKYLVTAIIYMDSDAAALSLAEYIASDELSFVKRMNETAKSLNMSSTFFANTSGASVVQSYPTSPDSVPYNSYALQYTTVSDLSLLFRYALSLTEFQNLFTKYKTLMFLSDGTPQTLTNTLSAAWGLNPQLKGAARFECSDSDSTSCILAFAAVDDFETAIILGGSQDDSIYQDLYKSINSIYSFYEVSDLVAAGDTYRQVSITGIPEPLAAEFELTVRYIHPIGNDFIKPNAIFIPSETVTLPVSIGQSLGQVRFELEDGTQIDAEVVAAESMWTKSDFLSDTMALLEANRNLSVIIIISLIFFIGSVLRLLSIVSSRLIRSQLKKRKSVRH